MYVYPEIIGKGWYQKKTRVSVQWTYSTSIDNTVHNTFCIITTYCIIYFFFFFFLLLFFVLWDAIVAHSNNVHMYNSIIYGTRNKRITVDLRR